MSISNLFHLGLDTKLGLQLRHVKMFWQHLDAFNEKDQNKGKCTFYKKKIENL